MKLLILSGSTGQGHNSVANAIGQELTLRGHTWECRDGLSFISSQAARFFSWGHCYMYRHLPLLFRRGYSWAEKHPSLLEKNAPARKYLSRGARELRLYLEQGQFDAIVCTHVFSAVILTEALRQYPMDVRTAFVATDYTCSPGVESTGMDLYFLPHPDLREEFLRHRLPESGLVDSAIPLRPVFCAAADKRAAKRELGISPEHRHILLVCGSMGCGPMKELAEKLIRRLPPQVELTIVCGTNQALRDKLTKAYGDRGHIHILGYTEDMPLLMDSADLYLTKPGGISTTEAAAKGLPMVFVDAVAGCEKYNLQFFLKKGAAVTDKNSAKLAKICVALLNDPCRLEGMGKAARGLALDGGAAVVCDTLESGVSVPEL